MKLPKPTRLKVSKIKPYESNPRVISEKSLEAVKHSIENYGYVQPIVVDKNHVIIAGHTRHQALTELGVESTEVYVVDMPEEKARAYRIVDNKTGELTDWDKSSLTMELRELEDSVLSVYFPDVDLELGQLKTAMREVSEEKIKEATEQVTAVRPQAKPLTTDIECPVCHGTFEVKTATLGVSQDDLELLAAQNEKE